MCLSFGSMGSAKAEQDINAHEQDKASAVFSEIKPFTTKAPVHVIEALDLFASHLGMTRNALVLKLLNQYMGQAFTEYSIGYNSLFNTPDKTDEQVVIDGLNNFLEGSEVSEQTKEYFSRLVMDHLFNT